MQSGNCCVCAPRFRTPGIRADDAMRSSAGYCGRLLEAKGDEDGLGYSFIERGHSVAWCMLVKRIMEDTDNSWIAPAEHSDDVPATAAVSSGWGEFHQYLVALHGAVYLIGRNKDVVIAAGLAGLRADEAKAVAVHI
jgi:hypothetical protein